MKYEIFTVNKTATYIIYGEMKHVTSEEVTLIHTRNGEDRPIQKITKSRNVTFFLDWVKLATGSRISISTCTEGSFTVYKL